MANACPTGGSAYGGVMDTGGGVGAGVGGSVGAGVGAAVGLGGGDEVGGGGAGVGAGVPSSRSELPSSPPEHAPTDRAATPSAECWTKSLRLMWWSMIP